MRRVLLILSILLILSTCKKNDNCPPWQIKAKEIKHDKENRELKPEDLRGMCREDIIPVCADLKSLYSRNALISKGFTTFRL